MKLLLDTHVVLWWLDDPGLIGPSARAAIENLANDANDNVFRYAAPNLVA